MKQLLKGFDPVASPPKLINREGVSAGIRSAQFAKVPRRIAEAEAGEVDMIARMKS